MASTADKIIKFSIKQLCVAVSPLNIDMEPVLFIVPLSYTMKQAKQDIVILAKENHNVNLGIACFVTLIGNVYVIDALDIVT